MYKKINTNIKEKIQKNPVHHLTEIKNNYQCLYLINELTEIKK